MHVAESQPSEAWPRPALVAIHGPRHRRLRSPVLVLIAALGLVLTWTPIVLLAVWLL